MKKNIIISFAVIIIFVICNILTFKGYYYNVDASKHSYYAYIKWNKTIYSNEYTTKDPKEIYKISGTEDKMINIMYTFYVIENRYNKKTFHFHLLFFDFEISNKLQVFFWHGNGYYGNKVEKLLNK